MYILTQFEIDSFWGNHSVKCDMNEDVNIFIGANGTGKTTLINILQAALTVDLALLHTLDFSEIRLFLSDESRTRKITVSRISKDSVYDFVKYRISQRTFEIPLVPNEIDMRRRFQSKYVQNFMAAKEKLTSLVGVSWLSVNRQLLLEEDYDGRDRGRRFNSIMNPVDSRLRHLLGRLSDYHLSLQAQANAISVEFQKQVLMSLLYSSTFDNFDFQADTRVDYDAMREQLYHAYEALGITSGIRKKIDEHVDRVKLPAASRGAS